MKILFIGNELSYRGTPKFLVNCARIAHSAGHKCCVWALEEGGPAVSDCQNIGVDVFIGIGPEQIARSVKFKPDIIHIHRAGGVSRRDNCILCYLKRKTHCRILETNVFGSADLTFNSPIDLHAHISRWDLWRWRRWFWPFEKPAIYLPCCVDTDNIKPTQSDFRARNNIPEEAFLIGRLGKTDWSIVAPLIKHVATKNNNVYFVTVNDYSGASIDNLDWPKEISNRIIRIDTLNTSHELSEFYSACDITLNFSPIGESFGFVVAESMPCGTPVVAHSKPRNDNAQIELAQSIYGCYPVKDLASAIETINKLSNHPPSTESKLSCRESIVKRYSFTVCSSTILKTYEILFNTDTKGRHLQTEFIKNGFVAYIPDSEIRNQLQSIIGGGPTFADWIKIRIAYSLINAIRLHRYILRSFPSNLPNAIKSILR